MIVRLDQRDGHPGSVDHAEIGSAAGDRCRSAPRSGPMRIELGHPIRQAVRRHEFGGKQRRPVRVPDEIVAFPGHGSVGLDQRMDEGGVCGIVGGVQFFEDRQRRQGQIPLRVGRHRPRLQAKERTAERFDPLGLDTAEVLGRDHTAGRLDHTWPDPVDVERVTPCQHRGERLGEQWATEHGSSLRWAPVRVEGWGGCLGLQLLGVVRPGPGQLGRGGKAFGGVAECRGEDRFERVAAEAVVERQPAIDAAGHRHRGRPEERHGRPAAGPKGFGVRSRARPAGGIEAKRLVASALVDQREEVASDAAGLRCDNALDRICGDGGVDGAATAGEQLDGGGGGEIMRGHCESGAAGRAASRHGGGHHPTLGPDAEVDE